MSPDHPPGLDLDRLRGHLDRERPGLVHGPLTARLIEGGRSNLTYAVTDGTGRWVVRTTPAGPCAGHRARHEARAPGDQRPAPDRRAGAATLLLCEDERGASERRSTSWSTCEGTPYRTAERARPARPRAHPGRRAGAGGHAGRPARRGPRRASGLGDFGRPEGFLDRQLRRWGKQLDASRNRELAGIDELHAALGRELPASPAPTVVHGDYRLDNVLIGADDRIKAILDWEMSTLGDPLTDLGLLVMYSCRPGPARLPRLHDRRRRRATPAPPS